MKYRLDIDDLPDAFEGWAFVLFHCPLPCYTLADSLNRLYDYRLARIDDLEACGGLWSCYRHEDSVQHLKYLLLERPAAADATWEAGDKLLIVGGENAPWAAEQLCLDLTEPHRCDPSDLLGLEHAALLDELLSAFTLVTRLDFSGEAPTSRRAQKERAAVEQCCQELLAAIERRRLDLSDEERRRAEEKLFRAV